MVILGLVPARGGSKGIPRKNLAPVGGRPLIAWTIDAARASRRLTRVVVSTDDAEIADVARRLGADVPFTRPPELSADETPMLDVVLHACEEIPCDAVALLQPTSPLRRSEHIDGALRLFEETGADCVVSVTAVPHRFSPSSLLELRDGRVVPLHPGGATRRQDKQELLARNGPAVLVVRTDALRREGTLYPAEARPFPMADRDSLDVDTSFELEVADAMLTRSDR